MKITQIQLPETVKSVVFTLSYLSEENDVYVVYWPASIVAEKYECDLSDLSPRMRPLFKIWENAIKKDTTELIVCDMLKGRSALVRIEKGEE